MRVSVVIPTFNRLAALRKTLNALGRQTFRDFEVVVVDGPSTDGTADFLASRPHVRALSNPKRNVSRSRNLALQAAAGELVALIDDDAIPEPRWLEELMVAFDDPQVGGCGGFVLDGSGVRLQWRYLVCARDAETDFERDPPLDDLLGRGADPFLYLAGGNSMYRREALAQVGGFDEEIEYNYEETELCLQLHDAGWRLATTERALVHHGFLPSHQRSAVAFTDPYYEVKNRVYFALRHGRATRLQAEVLATINRHVGHLRASARDARRLGRLDDAQLGRYLGRADAGYHAGLQAGLNGERRSGSIGPADAGAFVPYPTIPYAGRVVVVDDEPEARRLAEAGHEAHLLLTAGPEERYRVEYDDGVWRRTVPVRPRWMPEHHADPRKPELEREAALRAAHPDAEPDERFPTDWEYEARACFGVADGDEFLACLYRRLLGREVDDLGRVLAFPYLDAKDRNGLVAWLATSPEARSRGITPGFLERLPVVPRARAEVMLRGIWMLDDEKFARELHELLIGESPAEVPRGRIDRHAHFAELAAQPAALNRVAGLEHLPPPDVRGPDEIEADLAAVAGADTDAFADAVYRALLARPVDEAGRWSVHEALREGRTRREVIVDVASSEESAVRGVRPDAVRALLETSRAYRVAEARERLGSTVRRLTRRR